jgi:anti-sigma-K factor RskA
MDPAQHGDLEGVLGMSLSRTTREELAIDLTLGLADGGELERAERLAKTDPVFAELSQYWQNRMNEIDQTAPERTAMTLSWERLEQAIDAKETVAPVMVSANRQAGIFVSLWEKISFWRPAAIAAAFASMLLTIGIIGQLQKPAAQPVYVAVLQNDEGRAQAVVNAYADGTVTLVPLANIGVPQGRILEVWTLQTRERGPVSIGRMDQARSLKLDLKALNRPDAGHLFEITVEPPGGSPTGRPTGPILMKGLASTAL